MEFDINVVLVPATLVLLIVWLVDTFCLKQHRVAKVANQNLVATQKQLKLSETSLRSILQKNQLTDDVDALVMTDDTPHEVKQAHQAYQTAKRDATLAKLNQETTNENVLVRWAYEFLPILLFIILVRSFVIEPFNIPSSSMVPTLYTGDFIVVNKASYGLRLPLTHTKILDTGNPKRGDVVVFRYPLNPKTYYIKRVIGLPGDTVSYQDGVLSINGKMVETAKADYTMPPSLMQKLLPAQLDNHVFTDDERTKFGHEEESYARYYQENLDSHQYRVRYLGDLNASAGGQFLQENAPEVIASQGKQWTIRVPDGHYFALGDNRDSSQDSRYWGFIPEANLSGKATYIWMHKDAGFKLPSFERAGAID